MFLFKKSNTETKNKVESRPQLVSFQRISMEETVPRVDGGDAGEKYEKNQPNKTSTLEKLTQKKNSLEEEKEAPKKITRIESIKKIFQDRIITRKASQKNQTPDDKKETPPKMKLFDKIETTHGSSKKDAIQSAKEKMYSTLRNFPEQTRGLDFVLENQNNHGSPTPTVEETNVFSRPNSQNDQYWSRETLTPLEDWSDNLFSFINDYGRESGYDSDSIRTITESVINKDSASIRPATSHSAVLDSVPESNPSSPNLARKIIDEKNDEIIENIDIKNYIDGEKEACEAKISQGDSSDEVSNFVNEKLVVLSFSGNDNTVEGSRDEKISKETSRSCRVIGALKKDGTYESYE